MNPAPIPALASYADFAVEEKGGGGMDEGFGPSRYFTVRVTSRGIFTLEKGEGRDELGLPAQPYTP